MGEASAAPAPDRLRPAPGPAGVLLVLLACAPRPAAPPVSPPGVPPPAAPALDPALAADLAAAGADWSLAGQAEVAGARVELFRQERGLRLLYLPDPEARVASLQTWFFGPEARAEELELLLELERHPEAGPTTRRLEARGVELRSSVVASALGFRLTWPTGQGGSPEELVEVEGRRLAPRTYAAAEVSAARRARARLGAGGHSPLSRALDREPPALEPPQLDALRARLLVPRRLVVVAAGPLVRRELLSALSQWPGERLAQATPAAGEAAPPTAPPRRLTLEGERPRLLLAWALPAAAEERVAMEALAELLAGGEGSRLGQRMLFDLATSVEARVLRARGRFELELGLLPGRSATVARARVDEEIARVSRGETTGLELEVVRSSLRARSFAELAELEGRGALLARAELEGGFVAVEQRLSTLAALSEKSLRSTAARHLLAQAPSEVQVHAPTRTSPEEGERKRGGRTR